MDGMLWTPCWRYDDAIVAKAGGGVGSAVESPASDAGRPMLGGDGGGGSGRARKRPSCLTKDSSWTLDPLEEWTGMSRIESQRKLSLSERSEIDVITPLSSPISTVDATRRAKSHP